MRILIAPDKFKGTLSSFEVCDAIEEGLMNYDAALEIKKLPLADGGDGSLEILEKNIELETITIEVKDPLFRSIEASYKLIGNTAYIEMARASGLELVSDEHRNTAEATSFGTGQLILDACRRGVNHIYLFIGGSATTDGGLGTLAALGIKPIGSNGIELSPIGSSMIHLTEFVDQRLVHDIQFTVVCDVNNFLYGPEGAAYIYAPQKGANAEAVEMLDDGLKNLAKVIQESMGISVDNFEGSGAAGGIAAGIKGFFKVQVRSGIDAFSDIVGLEDVVKWADLVITGEGKFDLQTLQGKVVKGVYELCEVHQTRLAVIAGILDLPPEELERYNIWKVSSLVSDQVSAVHAQQDAYSIIRLRAFELLQEQIS